MSDNLKPRMPSIESMYQVAMASGVSLPQVMTLYTEYATMLSRDWPDFWTWQQYHTRNRDNSRQSKVISDADPSLFFNDDDQPPKAFYDAADTVAGYTSGYTGHAWRGKSDDEMEQHDD